MAQEPNLAIAYLLNKVLLAPLTPIIRALPVAALLPQRQA